MRFLFCSTLFLLLPSEAAAQFAPDATIGSLNGAISVRTLDVNDDDRLDLVIGGTSGAFWIENLGQAGFGSLQTIQAGFSGVRELELADIDEDGDLDPYLSAASSDLVVWFENQGGGAFGASQTIATINGAYAAKAGDLNGDMHLDMLIAGYNADTISWYSGDGSGAFTFEANLATGFNGASDVELLDVDNDGDLDAVAGADLGDRIDWFRNDGSGSFSNAILVTTGTDGVSDLHSADLDGDGRLDLLSTSTGDERVAWYRNTGNDFGPQQIISNQVADPFEVHVEDIDYDGIPDVFVANFLADSVTLHRGLGMGFFGAAEVLGSGFSHNGMAGLWTDDLDCDGDRDLIAAAFNGDRIFWYEYDVELSVPFCPGELNSTGLPGRMFVTGSPNAADNSAALNVEDLPLSQFGFFVTSLTEGFTANPGGSQGNLCLSGQIGRYNRSGEVFFTGVFGAEKLPIDLTDTPLPLGTTTVMAGETRRYQAWYRDNNPGATSNFSDGVSVTWQ